MSRKQYVMTESKRFPAKYLGFLLVLAIFIFFFFPFYGLTLRYYIGSTVSKVTNFIGMGCIAMGIVIIAIGFIGLLTGSRLNTKWMVIGIVLLWVGCWLTDVVIEFFGVTFGDSASSQTGGYH